MTRGTWCGLAGVVVAALLAVMPAPADATLWWYGRDSLTGQDNATCRQSGFWQTDATTCSTPGPNYLDTPTGDPNKVHIREGGIGEMAQVNSSGDYCFHHHLRGGGYWDVRPTADQSPYTDFRAASSINDTDFYRYQQADHLNNRCQAFGTQWGQHVYGVQNNYCADDQLTAPCGMAHYVSFANESLRDRPWDPLFGPYATLNITITADPRAMNLDGEDPNPTDGILPPQGGAWGYVCGLFQEIYHLSEPQQMLEYCFETWKAGRGFPNIQYDERAQCQSFGINNIDQVIARFGSYTRKFATPRHGTPETEFLASKQNGASQRYLISITRPDMVNAIRQSKSQCVRDGSISENPGDWALVGINHGMEGGGLTRIGGNESRLELYTTTDTLSEGQVMTQGQQIVSMNGMYRAQMQNDGNFVVYDAGNRPVWASGSTYGSTNAWLSMQPDDNLVIYPQQGPPAIWQTNTMTAAPSAEKSRLVMQNDGNLVLYRAGVATWSIW